MSAVTEFDGTMQRIMKPHREWVEKVRVERDAPRKGVFAHSPDPIVFGPDTLRFTNPSTLDFKIDDRYYIAYYRRSDFPDLSRLW
jgi:hypothetical protein